MFPDLYLVVGAIRWAAVQPVLGQHGRRVRHHRAGAWRAGAQRPQALAVRAARSYLRRSLRREIRPASAASHTGGHGA